MQIQGSVETGLALTLKQDKLKNQVSSLLANSLTKKKKEKKKTLNSKLILAISGFTFQK